MLHRCKINGGETVKLPKLTFDRSCSDHWQFYCFSPQEVQSDMLDPDPSTGARQTSQLVTSGLGLVGRQDRTPR